jgi:transposase InsO family protein
VTPDRRRRAVTVLVERFGVSQRRACKVVGQHRTTQRRPLKPELPADAKLRSRLRRFARNHPRMGWRKAHTVVRREGYCVNHKKLRRLWREEGLRRPPARKNKKRRPGGLDGRGCQFSCVSGWRWSLLDDVDSSWEVDRHCVEAGFPSLCSCS